MITQIKARNRVDKFKNDVRAPTGKKFKPSRYVYLALLVGFFAYLGNVFVGHYIWLRADGLVSADKTVVGPTYESQVTEILVQPGQKVKKGQVIGRVYSTRVAEQVAELTGRYAEVQARASDLVIRLETAQQVVELAQHRLADAETNAAKTMSLRRAGIITDASQSAALNERYAAAKEKSSREVEIRVTKEQLAIVRQAQVEARKSLDEMKRRFNSGEIIAPASGIIGPQVARAGDTLGPGDHIAEIYQPTPFVLAYLETGTLYKVKTGDRVKVVDGFNETPGTIVDVLPMTVPLPGEFQKTFSPTGRGQVAKITLDRAADFPLFNKVRVTGHDVFATHDLTSSFNSLTVQDWSLDGFFKKVEVVQDHVARGAIRVVDAVSWAASEVSQLASGEPEQPGVVQPANAQPATVTSSARKM